jgi:hypothetical protein
VTRRRTAAAGLAALALAIALVAVLALRNGGDATPRGYSIQARATLSPRSVLFGDLLTARIDVTVDPRRLDPDSVRAVSDFTPWEVVGRPVRTREDAGATVLVRTTWTLRCLTAECIPPRDVSALEFDSGRVSFRGGQPLEVTWPVLYVHSRLREADAGSREGSSPWRIDVLTLPAATYRITPSLLAALLLAAAGAFAALGIFLGYALLPKRREPPPPPPPAPRPPPPSALEQALALLEQAGENGSAERRRALELVADELATRDHPLAGAARALAWSEHAPPVSETRALAARVREALGGATEEEQEEDDDATA